MRLRKVKKNKKLNGFQLKQQSKQRKLNQLLPKRITNEKMKSFKTRKMKVSDLKNLINPYEHFTNSTDNYLPLERLECSIKRHCGLQLFMGNHKEWLGY